MSYETIIEKIKNIRHDLSEHEIRKRCFPRIYTNAKKEASACSDEQITARLDSFKPVYEARHEVGLLLYILALEEYLEEEKKKQLEADKRAAEVGVASAKQTFDVAAEILIEEIRKREENEKKLLEELLKEKDQIIQEYQKSIEVHKEALNAKQNVSDLQDLTREFLRVAQENLYLLNLVRTMKNPLDPILMRACMVGDYENVKAAIRLGANINYNDGEGNTPLHKACFINDTRIVRVLLANVCNRDAINSAGQRPIDLTSDPEIIKLLSPQIKNDFSFKANALPTLFANGNTIENKSEVIIPSLSPPIH